VANAARLDANAHLVVAGIPKRPPYFSELAWFAYLNRFVALTHFRCSLFGMREPRRSCRGAFEELAVVSVIWRFGALRSIGRKVL
jgi:hypothetical protein